MVKWVKVLFVEPGKAPEVQEMPNNLKSFELAIGGYIEMFETDRAGCVIICEKDGLLTNKPASRAEITGTFVIARIEPPELRSLTDEDVEVLSNIYR